MLRSVPIDIITIRSVH